MKVDIDAGLYFTGAIMIFASVILIPSAYASMKEPKVYKAEGFIAGESSCKSITAISSNSQSQDNKQSTEPLRNT